MAQFPVAWSFSARELSAGLYERSWLSQDFLHWLRQQRIDPSFVFNIAGPISEHSIAIRGRHFRFTDDHSSSTCAVVQVVTGDDAETAIDLIAWRRSKPCRVFQYFGKVEAIGVDQIQNPTSWFLDKPLYVHASPLDWLRAKCTGIVILDFKSVRARLARLPIRTGGRALATNNREYGRTLLHRLAPLPENVAVLVPEPGPGACL